MKKLLLLLFILSLIVTWFISFLFFASSVSQKVQDESTKTDVIVVLTGGANRVKEAVSLLTNNMADTMFISGVHKETSLQEIIPVSIPDKKIVLGKMAHNTLENAIEIADFIKEKNINSIRLVTSSYHMKRSILEVESIIPNIKIIPHPVFSESFKHKDWWKWSGSIWLLASEHTKYNLTILRNLIFSTFNLNYQSMDFLRSFMYD